MRNDASAHARKRAAHATAARAFTTSDLYRQFLIAVPNSKKLIAIPTIINEND